MADRDGAKGFVLLLAGALLFTQATVGRAVERIRSYEPGGKEPDNAGRKGSVPVATPRAARRALRVRLGVKRGDPHVLEVVRPAALATGHSFTVTSWLRVGANVNGDPDRPSCHRHGRGSRKGALDIVPDSGDWGDLDDLDSELRQTDGIGEIVWRGAAGHDPRTGAERPHMHVGVGCG